MLIGCCRSGEDGGEGVVSVQREGQEIPNRAENKQGNGGRVLEGHREGQGSVQCIQWRRRRRRRPASNWDEEDPRFLQRQGPSR